MRRGFVFGKYLPFHSGHEALISFALSNCDFLYVVVCGSHRENIPTNTRASWIRETFTTIKNIEIIELDYDEAMLPNTSISSETVSKVWAKKFQELLPEIDVLITSEKYGDFVAKFMGIEHLPFDEPRRLFPISSTKIRNSIYTKWRFLPVAVKKYYQKKVVFLGTESTGKTSLCKAISKMFDASLVEEVGREVVENSNFFSQHDLKEIAVRHSKQIKLACAELNPYVFIDTDIHITQSYSKYKFGSYFDVSQSIYQVNLADLYFYLTKELEFSQDGTRLGVESRNTLDLTHRKTLKDFDVDYVEISGSWEERFEKIMAIVSNDIQN